MQAAKINEELIKRHEQMMKDEFNRQVKDMATGHAQPKPVTLLAGINQTSVPGIDQQDTRMLP